MHLHVAHSAAIKLAAIKLHVLGDASLMAAVELPAASAFRSDSVRTRAVRSTRVGSVKPTSAVRVTTTHSWAVYVDVMVANEPAPSSIASKSASCAVPKLN